MGVDLQKAIWDEGAVRPKICSLVASQTFGRQTRSAIAPGFAKRRVASSLPSAPIASEFPPVLLI